MTGRPDLEEFEPGTVYLHDVTGSFVEFVGRATMPQLDDEDVAVFRFQRSDSRYLIATSHSYGRGETFTPARQVLREAPPYDD